MKKIIVYLIIILMSIHIAASLDKYPIDKSGGIGYDGSKIKSINEILSLYTDEELNKVKEFVVNNSRLLEKIEGLDRMPNLERIDFFGCGIKKIENLDKLTKLKELNLEGNKITKIEGLDNLQSLVNLNLMQNSIQKIEGLNNLDSLKIILLSSNKIQKIENISDLKSLNFMTVPNIVKFIDEESYNYCINNKNLFKIKYKVKISNTVLMEDGKTDSKIIRKLNKGEQLQWFDKTTFNKAKVDGVEGKWRLFVTDKGEVGWCFDGYLEEVER